MKEKYCRKKIVWMLAGLICCLFLLGGRKILAAPDDTKKADEAARVVRILDVTSYGAGGNDVQASQSGYTHDYLEKISEITGWQFEYIDATWAESLSMLERGELDMISQVQYTPERAEKFLFSDYSMGVNCAYLLVTSDKEDIYYDDFQAFHEKKIGVITGIHQIELLQEFAEEKGFTYEQVEYPDNKSALEALFAGEIDMMLSESMYSHMDCRVVSCFKPDPIYFITSRQNPELMEELNKALEQIQTIDINFHGDLYQKYYKTFDYGLMAFTREEAEYIASHPVVRMNYNRTWMPICYESEKTGEFSGITADTIRLLEEEIGLTFEPVPTVNSEEIESMLLRGELDLIYGVSSEFKGRAEKIGFAVTEPYVEVPLALAKRTDKNYEEIHSVAIPENNKVLLLYVQREFPDYEIIFRKNLQACLEAVYRGEADSVFENVYVLSQFRQTKQYSNIEIVYSSSIAAELCFGVRKEDTLIISILNKAITRLNEKAISDIVVKNTMAKPELHAEELMGRYAAPGVLLLGVLIMLGLVVSRKRMEKFAFQDLLLGCANENRFLLYADKLSKSRRVRDYAIVSLDIDHFKMINNMFSFETGNEVLCNIAAALEKELSGREFFCRKADDHFLLCMKQSDNIDFVSRMQRIVEHLSWLPKEAKMEFTYTVSCGVCYLKDVDCDVHRAIGWASLARKKAKEDKKDSVVFYDSIMKEQAILEQDIVNHMEEAMANGEFCPYFQPQIGVADETVVGAEALARWIKPDGTMIYPDQFIPVFEKNGFITRLDIYIFEQVCKQIRKWLDMGQKVCRISVNVSQVHLRSKNFYLHYLEIMKRYAIPPEYIELELTESILYKNKEQTINIMNALRKEGIRIAMDDFGSGYSTLNMMKDLPIDYLKLDREFFNTSLDSMKGKIVVESVADMAHKLSVCLIAEGVETKEQVDFLRSIDCEIVQGYYYYRPMSVKDFEKLQGINTED